MKSILDISNVVYGGYYGSPGRRLAGFPIGGIRKVLGLLNANLQQSEFVLCFDGDSISKKELLPTYKAGRVPNYAVFAQLDLLKEILTDCGMPFYYSSELEADDYICSVINFLARVNDPDRVIIYSDDRDIACCVSDTVQIRNVTSNGICIDRNNFEERVVRGEQIPYNTILLHKMVYGDKSDNYPGLDIPGLRFDILAQSMLTEMKPFLDSGQLPDAAFMDLDVINVIIDSLPESFTVEMKERIKMQAQIVFPRLVDITLHGFDAFISDLQESAEPIYRVEKRHINVFGFDDFNRQKFDFYCSIMGLNKCHADRYRSTYAEMADAFKEKLKLRSLDLVDGVLAVERYNNRPVAHSNGSSVQSMTLPL